MDRDARDAGVVGVETPPSLMQGVSYTPQVSLSPGTMIGQYEVLEPIGAGGMGQVYRARDKRLQREVALKILPDVFASDADRLARFEREATTLASLNHPNIAQIFGITDAPVALVMELVDGSDLSTVIARGPLALPDTTAIARQIASALEAAHEQGRKLMIEREVYDGDVWLIEVKR